MNFITFLLIFHLISNSKSQDSLNFTEQSSSSITVESNKKRENSKPCISSNGIIRECVPYYLCIDGKINQNGTNVINIRFGGGKKCVDYFEECCEVDNSQEDEFDYEGEEREEKEIFPCGVRRVKKVSYKITEDGDGEAEFGEFPWMIAILKEEYSLNGVSKVYQCGGSLITQSVVLTAAHCVANLQPESLKIRAGEWNTQELHPTHPHIDVDVTEVIIHENFNPGSLHHGIALLILKNPLQLTDHINTICLPPQNMNFDMKKCIVTGWGKNSFGIKGNYQTVMKKVELPVVPFERCQESLRRTRLGRWFRLHGGHLCAGGQRGRDACQGDGGSPLICPIENQPFQYYQAGIVAWGIKCGENGTPGVYINVAKYRNWIDRKIRDVY